MNVWLLVSAVALILSLLWLGISYARYRRVEVKRPDFLAGIALVLLVLFLVLLFF
jgi:hypothetical protein